METQDLKRIVEALIFAADAPINAERILETLELKNGFVLSALIDELNMEYQQSGRAFTIRQVAGGYQIVTLSQYASWIKKLYLGRQKTRLSQAALETLALVAFKQPISRVEIAQIRGVNSDGVIGTLLERKLITISGRSEAVGRPLLYSTTPEFLKYFGLNDIADLPKPREIEELFSKEGMPEELLHALSQEDPQLSLPINADAAPASEDSDNKTAPSVDQSSPALVAIPLPVNMPQEFFSSEMDETPAKESSLTTPEPDSIPLDINEEVVTQLDDSDEPESLNDDPAKVPEPAPNPANEQKADTWVDQRDKISPVTLAAEVEEFFWSSPESSSGETEVVEVRAGDDITVISTAALGEAPFALAPANDDLFATVDEIALIGEPLDLPPANAKAPRQAKNTTANSESTVDILLNTLKAISEIDKTDKANGSFEADGPASLLKSDPAGEIDGWLAEEFSREEIAQPGSFEDFNAVVFDPLDGVASEVESLAKSRLDALSLALPDFPDLAEVETKVEKASPAAAPAPTEREATPLQAEESPAVEFISEAAAVSSEEITPWQAEVTAPAEFISAATSAPSEEIMSSQAEVSPPVEFISEITPAPSEEASWQAEVSPPIEFISEARPAPSEEVKSWQAEASPPVEFNPETVPTAPSQDATPLPFEAPMQVESVAETAREISAPLMAMSAEVEVGGGRENATIDINLTDNFSSEVFFSGKSVYEQTSAPPAAPSLTAEIAEFNSEKIGEKTGGRWAIFREMTIGWIKRTFDKLLTLVGTRS